MRFKQPIKLINELWKTKNSSNFLIISKSKLSTISSSLKTEIKNDTYFIKFNRPNKRNCLNFETIESLTDLLVQIDKNENIKQIVLYGEDQNFCSGFDLNEINQINQTKLIDLCDSNGNWFKSSKLLIAFVQGYAVGLGFELAIACDIVIADQSAKFGFLNRRFGVPTFLPLIRLRNKIGRLAAIELLDDSHLINSKEAYDLGLIKYLLTESYSLNQLDKVLKSIQINNDQLKIERNKLDTQFQINRSINELPDEWKNHNLNSANYELNARHAKFNLSFWNDIERMLKS